MKYTKILAVVAAALFITLLLTVPASADTKLNDEWSLSENGETLTKNGGDVFTVAIMPWGYTFDPAESKVYHILKSDEYDYVCSASEDSDVVMILSGNTRAVFVRNTRRAEFDMFLEGKTGKIYIRSEQKQYDNLGCFGYSDYEKITAYAKNAYPLDIDVPALRDCPRYTFVSYDETLSVRCEVASLVFYDGAVWFIDHASLENNAFNADGTLSFRQGRIKAVKLSGTEDTETPLETEALEKLCSISVKPVYIGDESIVFPFSGFAASKALFWIGFILVGFAVPAAAVVVGIVIPKKVKRPTAKRWYAVSVLGAVWILVSAVMLILILI